MTELVTIAAFARTHGVSKSAAQRWQAKGLLTLQDGRVRVEESDATLQSGGFGRFRPEGAPDLAAVRREHAAEVGRLRRELDIERAEKAALRSLLLD